jgi:isoleucyl-tRNA synthetase
VIRAVQETRKNAGFDVSDRIRLDLRFASEEDADAVEMAFDVADVAGETLALEHGIHRSDAELPIAEHTAVIATGTYANRDDFTIAVSRIGADA